MKSYFNMNVFKKRFCGYCGEKHIGDWTEFLAHLTACEKLLVKYLRKTGEKK
jgi:hypothetical protein